ncbi:MAG: hypothetical protein AB1746_15480, partial [Candidatus Zixiibacteriota bacterium]
SALHIVPPRRMSPETAASVFFGQKNYLTLLKNIVLLAHRNYDTYRRHFLGLSAVRFIHLGVRV